MKTSTVTRNFFNQPLRKCESQLSRPSFLSLWRQERGRSILELIRPIQMVFRVAHAVREVTAGLVALLLSIGANNRIYVGLVMIGVVAPLSSCIHVLFDRSVVISGWYHVNYFFLFLLISPSISVFFCLIGIFLLFPEGRKRAYALILPAGYTLGKIIWLVQVTSNEEFWSVVPWSFVVIGLLIVSVIFLMADWLAYNKFHRADAFSARFNKLCELADEFDDAKFKSMIKSVWREKKAFKKEF